MQILIDLDETMIDTGYRLTDNGINEAIKVAIAKGYRVGINSDSALPTCQAWYQRLGMNGAIVFEHGAAISLTGTDVTTPSGHEQAGRFDDLRQSLVQTLHSDTNELFVSLVEGVQVIRGKDVLLDLDPQIRELVLISPLRMWSLCLFTRVRNNQFFDFAPELLALVVAELKKIVAADSRFGNMWWDINPDYSICILHDASTKKCRGVAKLLNETGGSQLIMIGNSMSDYIGDPRVTQFAVANASAEYKQRSDRVASLPLTSGVVELLSQLPTWRKS